MVFLSKQTQRRRTLPLALVALLLCGAMALPATASSAPLAGGGTGEMQASESRVKAAFVYKFGDYVEWPDAAFTREDSPVVIGVVGAAPLAAELTRITSGRTIGGRPVRIRALAHGEPLEGLHVVFIGRTDRRNMSEALQASRDQPMLTITESDDGLALGSMINFVVVADKVRFDVAPDSAQAHRLKISSRLLAVARQVVEAVP